MSEKPISPLRRRMIEDMTVRNFVEKTRNDYIRHVRTFTAFLGRSPDTAVAEDLRRFQLHQNPQYLTYRCAAANYGSVPIAVMTRARSQAARKLSASQTGEQWRPVDRPVSQGLLQFLGRHAVDGRGLPTRSSPFRGCAGG
jgi:hypothetical protein